MWIIHSLFLLLIFASPALAGDTHVCADCERATVAQAISDAADGDTITIPADSCSWTSGVTVPDDENLTITGAGAGSTVITVSGEITAINMGETSSSLSGITMKGSSSDIGIMPKGTGWKIFDCAFECTTATKKFVAIQPQGSATNLALQGVIFNNTFTNSRVVTVGSGQMLNAGNSQHTAWTRELGLGGVDAVYIEYNTFTLDNDRTGNVIDGNYAGAYVARYNTIVRGTIEVHSVQGANRAVRKWEIYNNLISNAGTSNWYPFFIRGGTGVIFNNSVSGTWDANKIAFDNVRSRPDYSGTHDGENNASALSDSGASFASTDSTWNPGALVMNITDGSEGILTAMTAQTATCELSGGTDNDWDTGDEYQIWRTALATVRPCDCSSDWDTNEDATGYLCRDQIGTGPDAVQWEDNPAGANTQTKVPAYVWNNYYGETLMTVDVINDSGDHIQKDRDYFEAQHPTYTCYDCPHPLTGLPGSCDPNVAGVAGDNVGIHTMTLGGAGTQTFTLGGAGTQTFTVSP